MRRRVAVIMAIALFAVIAPPAQTVGAAPVEPPAPPASTSSSPGQIPIRPHARQPARAPLAPASLTTGGSWSWQNPKPNGNLLTAINCPSASTCFAAGQDSPILMTVNGGSTWSQQVRATGVNSISCTSTTVCVGVGDFGLVMTTADAGSHWAAQTVNGGKFLASVSCPSASVCFSAGYAGSILFSGNGGSTWTAQASGTTANLFGINCPSVSICYAAGDKGVITATANGGTTWTLESSTVTVVLLAIACPSTTTCGAVGAIGTIVSTTTSGATWSFQGSETRANLFGISCPSTSLCFSAGDDGEVHVGFPWIWGNSSVGADGGLWGISCPTITECVTVGDYGTIALTTKGGSGWSVQPLPGPGGAVSGVSCPSTTVCFAINGYTILGTTNGGSTWSQLFSTGQTTYLNSISCPTTSVCFAAGQPFANNPIIWKTTNGGTTWSSGFFPLYSGELLNSISCPTATDCVAVENNRSIVRTVDGVNWSAPTYGPCVRTCPTLSQVSCPAAGVCFVAASNPPGQILSTGGLGWQLSFDDIYDPLASGFTAINCPTTLVCYAAGIGPPSPGPGGAYATTTDGGVTWRTLLGPSSTQVTSISCPSPSTCYVGSTGSSIFHTADYGGTWDVQLGSTFAFSWYFSISCPTTTLCFAGGSAGTAGAQISTTTTAGAAWSRPQPAGSTTRTRGIDCPSSSDCYAAALNNILVSHDGGSTWAARTLTNGDQLVAMKCVSATTCYATGWPGAIYKTTDSGTTWTSQTNPLSTQDVTLLGVSCWSLVACEVVGSGDNMSTSDGVTWAREATPTPYVLFGVSCPSSSLCVAVGGNGTVMTRTANSWHSNPSATTNTLLGVSCPSPTTCYAVGRAGTVVMTNNQGASWTAQSSGVTNVLLGIACPRIYFCLASGGAGTAIVTLDGSHWSPTAVPTTNALRGVALPDPNHAWLVGNGGTILANPSLFPWTCSAVTESAAPPSPTRAGTSVVFTASAPDCPNPLYEFWILPPGGTWSVAQPYSTTATFNWSTTGKTPGTYYIGIWAQNASSPGVNCSSLGCNDAVFSIPYTVNQNPCTAVTETAAPLSPQPSGTHVTFTATATGCLSPLYEFWAKWQGSSDWQLLQDYSTSNSYKWNSTGAAAGTEYIGVWAKDATSSTSNFDANASIPFSVTTPTCSNVTGSATPTTVVHGTGTHVTITASASGCTNANPLYEFWLRTTNSDWQLVQPYSTSPTYDWNSTGAPVTTVYIGIWAKDAMSSTSGFDSNVSVAIPVT